MILFQFFKTTIGALALPMMIVAFIAMGCTPSAKYLNGKMTIKSFTKTDEIRIDGFYYKIGEGSNLSDTDKYFISVIYFFADGSGFFNYGFSTIDTNTQYIRKYVETKLSLSLGSKRDGWGRYEVSHGKIAIESLVPRTSFCRNLGVVRDSGSIVNNEEFLIDRSFCSWCDFEGYKKGVKELIPPERFYFMASNNKLDSSLNWLNKR